MQQVSGKTKSKLKTTSSLLTSALAAKQLTEQAINQYNQYKKRNNFFVYVYEDDDLFPAVEKWVLDSIPADSQKSIGVRYKRRENLKIKYSGDKEHRVILSGHKIRFSLTESEVGDVKGDFEDLARKHRPRTLSFEAETLAGKQVILDLLEKLSMETDKIEDPPRVKRYQWGDWYGNKIIPDRSLESIILKTGQLERILADVDHFQASRSRYEKIGMPYHRGYLFHGPPGTGKTSLAMALARYLGKDLNCLPLGDIKSDSDLNRLVAGAEGILLMEDLDVFSSTVESRDSEAGTASLSGLLNALDGVITPDGLITIMTTNDIDSLDPALIRSGRVDLIEKLDYLDAEQLGRLFFRIYGENLKVSKIPNAISPSDMIEIFKSTEDPVKAKALVKARLK